jgi:hypothetical protein
VDEVYLLDHGSTVGTPSGLAQGQSDLPQLPLPAWLAAGTHELRITHDTDLADALGRPLICFRRWVSTLGSQVVVRPL